MEQQQEFAKEELLTAAYPQLTSISSMPSRCIYCLVLFSVAPLSSWIGVITMYNFGCVCDT